MAGSRWPVPLGTPSASSALSPPASAPRRRTAPAGSTTCHGSAARSSNVCSTKGTGPAGRPVLAASGWNLLLGTLLLLRRGLRPVLMLLSVPTCTLIPGVLAPSLWLELYGGLVKNLAVIVLIFVGLVLENRR